MSLKRNEKCIYLSYSNHNQKKESKEPKNHKRFIRKAKLNNQNNENPKMKPFIQISMIRENIFRDLHNKESDPEDHETLLKNFLILFKSDIEEKFANIDHIYKFPKREIDEKENSLNESANLLSDVIPMTTNIANFLFDAESKSYMEKNIKIKNNIFQDTFKTISLKNDSKINCKNQIRSKIELSNSQPRNRKLKILVM